jgi:hypothetical protein
MGTDIVSYLINHEPIADFLASDVQERVLAISFITVVELCFSAKNRSWGE